jgi:hypothetical protein
LLEATRKILNPVSTIGVSFRMTILAQRNAIFGNGVHFLVIDMMDMVSVSLANSAGIIVAFSNHALELLTEGWRVRLKGFPAPPTRMIFKFIEFVKTFFIAKFTGLFSSIHRIFFSAIKTYLDSGFCSPFIGATRGTIFTKDSVMRKLFSANYTYLLMFSSAPINTTLFSSVQGNVFPIAFCRAKSTFKKLAWFYVKFFSTNFAFFIHFGLIKGASRSASQYCCSRNTGQTGSVLSNLTICNCVNNSIIS